MILVFQNRRVLCNALALPSLNLKCDRSEYNKDEQKLIEKELRRCCFLEISQTSKRGQVQGAHIL